MALTDYVDDLGELAGDALASGRVQVAVKTNLGPEFKIGEGQGRLMRALGIRAAVIVRDRAGRQLFVYGVPPPTNLALVVTLAGSVLVLLAFLVRGALKK